MDMLATALSRALHTPHLPSLRDVVGCPLAREVIDVLGMQHATAHVYLEHVHTRTRFGLRFLALLCAQCLGIGIFHRQQADGTGAWAPATAAGMRAAHAYNQEMSGALYAATMPLWLHSDGSELLPACIAHETMLKPEDVQHAKGGRGRHTEHVFLTHAEVCSILCTDDEGSGDPQRDSPGAYQHMHNTPVWNMIVMALHRRLGELRSSLEAGGIGRDALLAVRRDWLAVHVYFTLMLANAANEALPAALGCAADVCMRLRGRVVDMHTPAWLKQPANRLCMSSARGMASTDSIPISFAASNFDELKKISLRAAAYLMHAYVDLWRLMFMHVRHPDTHVHCDSASEVKLLLFCREMGWLAQRPLFEDTVSMFMLSCGHKKTSLTSTHPLCHVKLVIWGYTCTQLCHQTSRASMRSDTYGRVNGLVWCALGWRGGMATGGFMPPGVAGGSAQGKSPTPNDYPHENDYADVYAARRLMCMSALRSQEAWHTMVQDGRLRGIFPDLVRVVRLQACDYAAVVALVYRYTKVSDGSMPAFPVAFGTRRHGYGERMLWHVCGARQQCELAWPPDVARQHESWLMHVVGTRTFMCEPPRYLWQKGAFPRWPKTVMEAMHVLDWWEKACVPSKVYELRPVEDGAECMQ